MSPTWIAALCGFAVAALSAVIAWLALRWAATRPRLVVAAVMGGTMLRLLLVAVVTVGLLGFTDIDSRVYTVVLIISYLAFLGVEIYLIARRAASSSAAAPETE